MNLPAAEPRRAYDHRLREHVCRTGARSLDHRIQIPRSTISSWKRRGLRPVITIAHLGEDWQELLCKIEKLERRARLLAAVVRLLLALLRASGIRVTNERLPEGAAKEKLLRAVQSAEAALPLRLILRIIDLSPSRYHAWRRAAETCRLDDRSSCPPTLPTQLTAVEIATIREMILAPEHRHMPFHTLSLYAQRIGEVFASASTWARLIRKGLVVLGGKSGVKTFYRWQDVRDAGTGKLRRQRVRLGHPPGIVLTRSRSRTCRARRDTSWRATHTTADVGTRMGTAARAPPFSARASSGSRR